MPHLPGHDGDIFYEVSGSGQPLVLIRGLGRSVRHWHGYDQVLAESFKVITLDLRGIGRTTKKSRISDTIFDLADDVATIINHVGESTAHVLGVSLGGMITLAFGIKHPEKCRSLAVINTSIAGLRTPRLTRTAAKIIFTGSTYNRRRVHDLLADVLTGSAYPKEGKSKLAEAYKQIARQEGMNEPTVVRQLVSAARFQVRPALQKMSVPTLVLYGTDDRFVPPQNSKKLFSILPNARLVGIEDGGHELTVDHPDEVLRALKDWTAAHAR